MSEEELLALYALVRKEAEGMAAREKALQARTAALDQSIGQLQQLPLSLGKQTSEYIAMGVRQAIQDDFSRPIAESVKGPLSELHYATNQAREVMRQVRSESRLQTWSWVAILIILGIALGGVGSYWFFVRDLNQVNERLEGIQLQMMPTAPVPDAKPLVAAPSSKGHRSSHVVPAPSVP